MRFLPVFLDLQAGPVLLVGAGELARAKLRLLAAAGARIRWFATDGNHDVNGLEAADAARIEFADGDPLTADLGGVIAILCAGAGDIGVAMSARAKAVGLPVNVMDDLDAFHFHFPGHRRSRRRGRRGRHRRQLRRWWRAACASASRRCCRRASAISPASSAASANRSTAAFAEIAAAPPVLGARDRRPDRRAGARRTQRRGRSGAERYRRSPALCRRAGVGEAEGRVTLVGAGPGDPDLLTVKALRALQDADVVFYDELVSPEILDRARRDASRIPVGRRVGKPGIGQDAINRLLIEAAKSGQRAVRLKGGDRLRVRPRRRRGRGVARGRRRLFGGAGHYRRASAPPRNSRCR